MRKIGLVIPIAICCLIVLSGAKALAADRYEILWDGDGVQFAPLDDPVVQYAESPLMVPDGAGGSFVLWSKEHGSVYAQHIDGSGTLLWGVNGRLLLDESWLKVKAIADGTGGMIVSWLQDGDWGHEIWAQRFDADGIAQWTEKCIFVYPDFDYGTDYNITSDGAGGAFLALQISFAYYFECVYAQKIDSDGNMLWGSSGVAVNTVSCNDPPSINIGTPRVVPDGSGGAIVAYTEEFSQANQNRRIEVARVDAGGTLLWTELMGATDADAYDPELIYDGYGGAIVSWVSELTDANRLFAQRFDSTGSELWTPGGEEVCSGTVEGNVTGLVGDGAGGAIVAWSDNRGAGLDIYGQRIDSSGIEQWTVGGAAVCSASGDQFMPHAATDDAGGAVISWQDMRNGVYRDIYAQRVDPSGVALWTIDGEIVCDELYDQTINTVVGGGAGEIIVLWMDYRLMELDFFELYVQKMDAAGTPQLAENGEIVCEYYSNFQNAIDHVDDGYGGAIAVWVEQMGGLIAQRVDSLGLRRWTDEGHPLCTDEWRQDLPQIIGTDGGGAIVTWQDRRNGYNDIYAQKIDSTGTGLWIVNGIGICTNAADQHQPKIVPDGAGGAIITWRDYRNGNADIFAQRIDGSGVAQWAADGIAVCTHSAELESPEMIPDGAGGAIIIWTDFRAGRTDIYAQSIDPGGSPRWTTNGVPVCYEPYDQINFRAVTDGAGGAIIVWQEPDDYEFYDIFAQHIDSGGNRMWGGMGVPVCTYEKNQISPRLVTDGEGGAIVAWIDARHQYDNDQNRGDVFAQRIDGSGSTLWAATGIYLTDGKRITNCDLISDGNGGAFIIWASVYAQHIDGDAVSLWPTDWPYGNNGVWLTSSAYEPHIASDGDEGALITWYYPSNDLPGKKVYGQRIVDADVSTEIGPVLFVDTDATGIGDGSSWEDAFIDLKQALDTAAVYFLDVEEIWVAEGTYRPTDGTDRSVSFVLPRANLALYGGFDGTESESSERNSAEHVTVLSGDIGVPDECTDNSYHVVRTSHTDTTTVLDGFVIEDGYATDGDGGGGLFAPYPIKIRNMTFIGNTANASGGGAYLAAAGKVDLLDIVFEDNVAAGGGGGLYLRSISEGLEVLMCRVQFRNNSSTGNRGGGLKVIGDTSYPYSINISLDDAVLTDNHAVSDGGAIKFDYGTKNVWISNAVISRNSAGGNGGGLCVHGQQIQISNVEFSENVAGGAGGGLDASGDGLSVSNAEFIGNEAGYYGGGISTYNISGSIKNVEFRGNSASNEGGGFYTSSTYDQSFYNCVFHGNSAANDGAGIYLDDSNVRVVNTTFSKNSGSNCIYDGYSSDLDIVNSILWDNEVPPDSAICRINTYTDATVSYSIVEDCWIEQSGGGEVEWNALYGDNGGHNLDEDPLFVDAEGGDLRLLAGSPAIDAGNESVSGLPATDILGNPRIIGETIDMGAYEGAVPSIQVTVTTDPPVFEVIVAGESHVSPYISPSVSGTEIEIGVVSPQWYHGHDYYFVGWSDGGDTTHVVTLPDTNVTYMAIFSDEITGDEVEPLPLADMLHQNHPNPFNPSTTISFSLRERGHASLAVYDVAGRLVRVLAEGVMEAGPREVTWDGRDRDGRAVASGVYFYRLETGVYRETRKMVLLR